MPSRMKGKRWQTATGEIAQPDGLTPAEAGFFRRIKGELKAVGYNVVDEPLLRAFLTAFVRREQAKRIVDSGDMIVTTPAGQLQAHPALTIERQYSELLKKYAQELAFSPGARQRLKIDLEEKEDDDI